MKPIDDIRDLHKKYSVWALVAIFLVAVADAAAPLIQPWLPAYVYPLLIGVLAVVGVLVRGIKQGGNDAE